MRTPASESNFHAARAYLVSVHDDDTIVLFSSKVPMITAEETIDLELLSVREIWEQAFLTDLIRFQDQWSCVFREGLSHQSRDGQIRVIRSSEGDKWLSMAVLPCPPLNQDLRDPKLSLSLSGELVLTTTAYLAQQECRNIVHATDK